MVEQMVKTTKVEMRAVPRMVVTTVMKPTTKVHSKVVNVPKMITETRQEMRDVTRDVQKTRMVKSQQTRQQTEWVPQTTTQKAWRTVKKTVMHNKTVASVKQL